MSERLGLRLRARRWQCRAVRDGRRALGLERTVYVESRTEEYRACWEGAARLLGADFATLAPGIWEARLDGRSTRLCGHLVQADDPVTLRVAGDKALCHALARRAGVSVPEHHLFRLGEARLAARVVERDRGPWVVKPARGSASGLGVTTGIVDPREVEDAAVLASLFSPELLLERMAPGESCRLLFLDGELLHAVRRRGARVTGDGVRAVHQLAAAAGFGALARTPSAAVDLAAQALSADDVPAAGREVLVRGVPPTVAETRRELRTVYDEDVTSMVHPATIAALAEVVRLAGSRFAGVDWLTVDPAAPPERAGVFLELNTTPGIHHHYQSDDDRRTHPVAVRVLRTLLGAG
ncbi:MAG TPA: hypothetical protein VFQ39_13295 [Longimicrobium sp.]|nr:hypothetical protein [Longimicrobium sp.]